MDVELQEVRRPLDLDVGADLDALHAHLELLAVEIDVAEVKDRCEDLEDGFALFVGEAEHLHGRGQCLEVVAVVFAINGAAATLEESLNHVYMNTLLVALTFASLKITWFR